MPVYSGKTRMVNSKDDVRSLVEHMLKEPNKTVSVIIPMDFLEMIQARAEVSDETIKEYHERMELGDIFPDVEVIISPEKFELLCYNGFHRMEAEKLRGNMHINATVRLGTRDDAEILAAGANAESTKPRTSEDKRMAVKMLLRNPVRAAWSNNRLAKLARVSPPLVEDVRQQLEEAGLVARPAKRQAIRNGKPLEIKATAALNRKVTDPVQAIVDRIVKAAKGFDADSRARLSELLVAALRSE